MRRNATALAGEASLVLQPKQDAALAALLGGQSVTDAATTAGVDRSTVHRWLKDDDAFQAALNRGRRERHEAMSARLLNLAEKATECVERAIDQGDGRTALAMLKGLGLLSGQLPKVGSDDSTELREKAAQQAMFGSCSVEPHRLRSGSGDRLARAA